MPGTLDLLTASPEETHSLGRALAELLEPGDVVSLTGDLGAGKTTLVQGIAAGLGVEEPVLSPTFTLERRYRGRIPVHHLDVYRLNRLQDVLDLGFEELLDDGGVVLIEWGDAVQSLLPEGHIQVELWLPEDLEQERRMRVTASGASWAARWTGLEALTAPWQPAAQDRPPG